MLILIDPEMQCLAEPAGKMGRPAAFSDMEIGLCLSVKVLFKLPPRQTVGNVRALLKLAGLGRSGQFHLLLPPEDAHRPESLSPG